MLSKRGLFRLLGLCLWPGYRWALAAYEKPRARQGRLLASLMREARRTEYGRNLLPVGTEDDLETFRACVPVVDHDALAPWIETQCAHPERPVLCSERVDLYEKTSGSSGPAKRIPYTRRLRAGFSRMFRHWLCDLLLYGPRFESGRTYMSVSPGFRTSDEDAGLENDAEYVGGFLRGLVEAHLSVPPEVKRLRDPDAFKRVVCAHLAADADLEIISIWNPTLFELYLDYIQSHWNVLSADLARGAVTAEGMRFPLKRRRALPVEPDPRLLWPKLKLVSAWSRGASQLPYERLRSRLVMAVFQGKGLLATEAPLSFPSLAAGADLPLLDDVFFEFEDETGALHLLDEIKTGVSYGVIISQAGGLLRYRLGDKVSVRGRYRCTPCFEFETRAGGVSDLVGEKLSEAFLQSAVSEACGGNLPEFICVLPGPEEQQPRGYLAMTQGCRFPLAEFEEKLERALMQSHHYRYARLLGQIAPLRAVPCKNASLGYLEHFLGNGMKMGDIKPRLLVHTQTDADALLARLAQP